MSSRTVGLHQPAVTIEAERAVSLSCSKGDRHGSKSPVEAAQPLGYPPAVLPRLILLFPLFSSL